MIEFLTTWAEQLIVALIIIIMIEMIIPNSSYRKYIKIVLGIFILYIIFNPLIKNKFNDFNFQKQIENQVKSSNISQVPSTGIDYNKQIQTAYKEKFKENIYNNLLVKGYKIENIDMDVSYEKENIITNKLKLIIKKNQTNSNIKIEKVEISEVKEDISNEELETLKKDISNTYNIETSKIFIESEKTNG